MKFFKRENQDLWYGEGEINDGQGKILPGVTVYQNDQMPDHIGTLRGGVDTVVHVAGNTWKAIPWQRQK